MFHKEFDVISVIIHETKTIHRLFEFQNGSLRRNREHLLGADVLVVDECSMLDISLTAALLSVIPDHRQVEYKKEQISELDLAC